MMLGSKMAGVLEELLNEINMCHDHAAAAIPLATKLVHRITCPKSVFPTLRMSVSSKGTDPSVVPSSMSFR